MKQMQKSNSSYSIVADNRKYDSNPNTENVFQKLSKLLKDKKRILETKKRKLYCKETAANNQKDRPKFLGHEHLNRP